MEIILDHLAPLLFGLLGNPGKTVTRKIHQVEFSVYIVVVDGLCLTRLLGCSRIVLTVHKTVDQRALSNI